MDTFRILEWVRLQELTATLPYSSFGLSQKYQETDGGRRNHKLPSRKTCRAVGSGASTISRIAFGSGTETIDVLTTSSSGALSDSNFSFGLNRSSSDDATVARKLGKWLTDCPLFHEDAARNGLYKNVIASSRHNHPRPLHGCRAIKTCSSFCIVFSSDHNLFTPPGQVFVA